MKLAMAGFCLAVLAGCGVESAPTVVPAVMAEPVFEEDLGSDGVEEFATDALVQLDVTMTGNDTQETASAGLQLLWEALPEPAAEGYREIEWQHLMPPNFNYDMAMSNLDDAPVVDALNGEPVRIAGYVLPLDTDMERVYRFLIVPYIGACVHVPPPPSNQIIYAQSEDGMDAADLWEAVYVYGTLNTQPTDTEWGASSYVLEVDSWKPYEW